LVSVALVPPRVAQVPLDRFAPGDALLSEALRGEDLLSDALLGEALRGLALLSEALLGEALRGFALLSDA